MKTAATRQTLLAGLAAALLLSTSLTAVSLIASRAALADEAADAASLAAFFQHGYGWCDADVLGKFWGIDFYQAKIRAGQKVERGEHSVLADMLSEAYGGNTCGQTSSLDYDDATAVATLWMAAPQG